MRLTVKNQASAIEMLYRDIRARFPLIGIISHEETRVMASIQAVAEHRGERVVAWTMTQGLQQVRPTNSGSNWKRDDDLQCFDPD
jgi:TolB-like protein